MNSDENQSDSGSEEQPQQISEKYFNATKEIWINRNFQVLQNS
jgi:hypothetical protein